MWLNEGTVHTRVVRATDEESAWLTEYLSFTDASARFSGAGKTKLYNVFSQSFPSGMLSNVRKAAVAEGFEVQLFDDRGPPLPVDPAADLVWLRGYQREALDRVIARRRGILWLPTGAGKTEIAVACTRAMPGKWLFLVHRTTLMDQAAARYELRSPGLHAGRIGEGVWGASWAEHDFVCANFQTIAKRSAEGDPRALELMQGADGLIVDEVHVLPANSFWRVAMAATSAKVRVGLSGTPLARGDKRSVLAIAATGPVIYRLRAETLIDAGVLAKPFVHMVECVQTPKETTWQGVYGSAIVRSTARNRRIVQAVKNTERPCLVFVKEVKHGKALEKAIINAGVSARFVWGTHSEDYRKTAIRDLLAGRIEALICSVIFQEGVDVPELRSVVVASGGKSVIAALQRIGRGMRRSDGKTEFNVFDIADRGCGCDASSHTGQAHAGCRWLEKHTRARKSAYVMEGYTTTMEQWPLGRPP